MKKEIKEIDAVPSKRIYLSIIADYHLKLALCELIDNAIDNWVLNNKQKRLEIKIDLDYERQIITVKDNSGGIKEEDIALIVSPGHTRENKNDEIIGIFGVGSKRAVVALAEEIKIKSRYRDKKTLLIELNDEWINDEDTWNLKTFEVDPIEVNTTLIELYKLREPIKREVEKELLDHLGATYAFFLKSDDLNIIINDTEIVLQTFEKWSYPQEFEPVKVSGPIDFGDFGKVEVEITAGLTQSHKEESSIDEFGVYFYCNKRLITRAYKGPEVGFKPPRVGKPHPSTSLGRVIVKLNGPVELMPWNSSKSHINFKHRTFREIEKHIERMLFTYVSMSKKWSGEWDEKVFKYNSGSIREEKFQDISSTARIHLPPIPRGSRRKKYADIIKRNNQKLAIEKPWVVGTYETMIAVEHLKSQKLEQNNRIALLMLDSAIEIAFKDYLVNDSGEGYSENKLTNLFKNRHAVHDEIKKHVTIRKDQWKKIKHFYHLRCELVHKRGTVTISDHEMEVFRRTYQYVMWKLFKVNFQED